MIDTLGDRMKRYEFASKILLSRRTYTIIRVDGCHFHTYSKGFKKPFDPIIIDAMQVATKYVCENVQGCNLGYVQSDEASFLLTDFDDLNTDAWYDNQLQKIVSVAASMLTVAFERRMSSIEDGANPGHRFKEAFATFDARAFILPNQTEVMNYFLWRIKDAERNSLAGLCQSLYSHKELMNKNAAQQQELLFQKGINWNDFDEKLKRGTLIHRPFYRTELLDDGTKVPLDDSWELEAAPRDKERLLNYIPVNGDCGV